MARNNLKPYEVLGITKDATEKDIQKAYKLQCLKWHPDKNRGNEKEAERRFIQAKEAFELLYDKERRAEHDKGVEATRVRDERQRERMEKADDKRRKMYENLKRSEELAKKESKFTVEESQKRKEQRIKNDFEELANSLFKEVEKEIQAKNEKLEAQLAEHKKQKVVFTGKLRIKWPCEIIFKKASLRKKFSSYGTFVVMSSIIETKKRQKMCIIEFSSLTEAGLRLELSPDDKIIFKIDWVEMTETKTEEPQNPKEKVPVQSSTNYETMSFDELMAHFDSLVITSPVEEKGKK